MTLQEAREKLDDYGVAYKKTHGLKTLIKLIDEQESFLPEPMEDTLPEKIDTEIKPKSKPKSESRELNTANDLYPTDGLSPVQKATRLIRIRVINRDPDESWKKSETVKISTAKFGTLCSRQITFGIIEHIEYVGLAYLLEKKYNHKTEKKNPQTGESFIEQELRKTFSIEVLEPISESELKTIANRQLTTLKDE